MENISSWFNRRDSSRKSERMNYWKNIFREAWRGLSGTPTGSREKPLEMFNNTLQNQSKFPDIHTELKELIGNNSFKLFSNTILYVDFANRVLISPTEHTLVIKVCVRKRNEIGFISWKIKIYIETIESLARNKLKTQQL